MTAPRVVFVGRHFRHHAMRSGYAELATHIDKDAKVIPGFRWIPGPLARLLARRAGIRTYGIDGIRAEAATLLSMLVRKGWLYHFVYGESHFRYSGAFAARRGHRILCTFHQPPEVLARILPSRDHLKALAGVIVVARCQVPFFAELLGPERVFFVPHGIDTSFFRPPEVRPATRTCLSIGHWLRDFAMLKEAVAILRQRDPAVRLEIISAGEPGGLRGTEGVTVESRIPTAELIARYQRAALLLLPLHDATANNALLEAMACGLPAVVTDVGGIRDYVDERSARLVPKGDAARMAEEVKALLDDPLRREALGRAARERALEFDWSRVARSTAAVHASLR